MNTKPLTELMKMNTVDAARIVRANLRLIYKQLESDQSVEAQYLRQQVAKELNDFPKLSALSQIFEDYQNLGSKE